MECAGDVAISKTYNLDGDAMFCNLCRKGVLAINFD
jgi:hypothetical protein